jgi:hypothetical protein
LKLFFLTTGSRLYSKTEIKIFGDFWMTSKNPQAYTKPQGILQKNRTNKRQRRVTQEMTV